MDNQYVFYMRMYILEQGDEDEVIREFNATLDALGIIHASDKKPYWKIPQCTEAYWRLGAENTPDRFEALLSHFPVTWVKMIGSDGEEALWNKNEETMISPSVRWCIIEFFPKNRAISDGRVGAGASAH